MSNNKPNQFIGLLVLKKDPNIINQGLLLIMFTVTSQDSEL